MKVSPTPGGRRLRALREYYGKTQLDAELDAGLGIGYLQRLELGRVRQPERDTLERILTALDARYTERREVLELFGYVVDAPLPDETAIDWAISVCANELDSAVFPAYLLDCGHRLLYWNALVPKLFNASVSPRLSMLRMVFDSAYPLNSRIRNTEGFFAAQIRALRYEMQRFQSEAWVEGLLDNMLQCRDFRYFWNHEAGKTIHIPARPLTPLELQVQDQTLRFRLISEPFIQDHRFRVLFYLPVDAQTTQQCLNWLHLAS